MIWGVGITLGQVLLVTTYDVVSEHGATVYNGVKTGITNLYNSVTTVRCCGRENFTYTVNGPVCSICHNRVRR
jgi:hypothetical protein